MMLQAHLSIFLNRDDCRGLMKPVGLDYSSKKGYQLIHCCVECNKMIKNKVALDTEQEDQLIYFMKTVI